MAKKPNLIVFLGQTFQSKTSVFFLFFFSDWSVKQNCASIQKLVSNVLNQACVLLFIQAVQHYQFEMFEYHFS